MTHCARCGDLETAHELRTDNRTRGKRLGQTATSEGNELCAGFEPGEVVEMVPEGELRRRLDAVLALGVPGGTGPVETAWVVGYAQALVDVKRAARGES
jgi:hypothetical protein